jgi:hypothetical protein
LNNYFQPVTREGVKTFGCLQAAINQFKFKAMEKTYFIGLINDKCNKIFILQLRKSVDFLSCGISHYFGERINTKKNIKANKSILLTEFNKMFKTDYKRLIID